jgi:lipopolysaccharide biosynthesis glycosyltransferase
MIQSGHCVPVFFTSDESYAPYLSVAIQSLIENANPSRRYRVIIQERGMRPQTQQTLKGMSTSNVSIEMCHITDRINNLVKTDHNKLRADYVTTTIYFRLYIAELYPELDKAIYIDADTVVPGDVAALYDTDLNGNLIGAVQDCFMTANRITTDYVTATQGFDASEYVNSGVLLMDLAGLRSIKFADKFTHLLNTYHPRLIAPDQDYINAMLHDRRLMLDAKWNTMMTAGDQGPADPQIIHYNLFGKPWFYPDAMNAQYFWDYAPDSPFYLTLLQTLRNFTPTDANSDKRKKQRLLDLAENVATSDSVTFKKLLEQGVSVRV